MMINSLLCWSVSPLSSFKHSTTLTARTKNENRRAVWVILEIFWTVSLKVYDWSCWTLKNCEMLYSVQGLYNKKYCFTSDVMYKKYKKLVYTPSDLLARIWNVNLSNAKKCGPICFPRICFRGLIYCDQEPLWLLNVIEDVCYFLGVHIFRLSTRCKMYHSKITYPFPQKSHECALKLTDLWITSLLFDLKYKLINGSFAFRPG